MSYHHHHNYQPHHPPHRFQSAASSSHGNAVAVSSNHNTIQHLPEPPWEGLNEHMSSVGTWNGHEMEHFWTLEKRRKNRSSWGSDSSTIFTESTGQSSQSSTKSPSSSPVSGNRKGAHTQAHPHPPVHTGPTLLAFLENVGGPAQRDPRGTIESVEVVLHRQPAPIHRPIDVDSLEEYIPPPEQQRPCLDRTRPHQDSDRSGALQPKPLPPRTPRDHRAAISTIQRKSTFPPPSVSKSALQTRRIVLPPPPSAKPSGHIRPTKPRASQPSHTGPIDVDSLETYMEDASVDSDSLAMLHIVDESENTEECGDDFVPRKTNAPPPRQRTTSLDTSLSPDDVSFQSHGAFDEDHHAHVENGDGPNSAWNLDHRDHSDFEDEDDYALLFPYLGRFPILDETEDERVLCGYIRGFEPPVETVKVVVKKRRPSQGCSSAEV